MAPWSGTEKQLGPAQEVWPPDLDKSSTFFNESSGGEKSFERNSVLNPSPLTQEKVKVTQWEDGGAGSVN